jgi:hypothetical protein
VALEAQQQPEQMEQVFPRQAEQPQPEFPARVRESFARSAPAVERFAEGWFAARESQAPDLKSQQE